MRSVISTVLAGVCAVALVGCGGSGSTVLGTDKNPRLRLVNAYATPTTTNLAVDDEVLKVGAPYQFSTDYHVYENGNHQIKFADGTTSTPLIDSPQLLELNHYYTAIGYQNENGNSSLLFVTDKSATNTNDGQIRVLNASASPVDVYITAPDADISASSPTVSNEASGDTSVDYTVAPLEGAGAKTFEIRVTTPGTKVVLASTTVSLSSKDVKTSLVTTSGGVKTITNLPTVSY